MSDKHDAAISFVVQFEVKDDGYQSGLICLHTMAESEVNKEYIVETS